MEPKGGMVMASTSVAEEGTSKLGHPYYSDDTKAPDMVIAVPLLASNGRVAAVLAARLNLAALGAIAKRGTGIHRTEDSYLINAERLSITQPRFINEPVVLRRKLESQAARRCAAGKSGVMLGPDYRGVPVISIYRWNARRGLGLLVEIDQADALAPARSFRRSLLLISSLALLAAGGLAFMLARRITSPLLVLVDRVRHLGEEIPDQRLPESSGDEIMLLTRASLTGWRRGSSSGPLNSRKPTRPCTWKTRRASWRRKDCGRKRPCLKPTWTALSTGS